MTHTQEHEYTSAEAAATFEQIISLLPQLVENEDHEALLDVLIDVIEFRAALTKPGDAWDTLRSTADETRTQLRRIITDGALKAMDGRIDAIRDIAQHVRAIADDLTENGNPKPHNP